MSSSKEPVRVGFVGLGNIGHYHADRIVDLAGVDIVGGVDINPDARARFAEKYGVESFESYEDLFTGDVDAVVVTTPNKFHEEYAVAALETGVDVLLEKPLAHSLESAERIAEAARNADSFCMVGFHNRFRNPVEVVKGYQDDGRFGETRHVEANYVRRRGIPGRGSWFTNREIAGGGALIDIGVHAIDLALHFHDFPRVEEVSGTIRSQFGTREDYAYLEMWGDDAQSGEFSVDDSVSAFLRCEGGKTIALEVAWAANRSPDEEFVVRGTEAGACFDKADDSLTLYETGRQGTDHFSDSTIETRHEDPHKAEQRAFFDAVRAGVAPSRNTVEQGLEVQRVIDAIYRSNEEGRAIRLD
ncbi:Gfo/Idh/MocA family oxidoreductase [Halorussus salilacus]|uniref:Gfo/Idh/MocA family protein n=1 Tax=Halorussus salilacus TaxID=2953750 RepID=UPI00209CF457|nr:Gfo/Idh/MocA family oxidoreductase [Halorussus salilacus]USZ68182.1 Gfo/Idh/MocA family oxidoreductase [Halorussus salilacus]